MPIHSTLHILLLDGNDQQSFQVNSHDWITAADRRAAAQQVWPSSQSHETVGKPTLFWTSISVHLILNVGLKNIKPNGTEHVDIIKLMLQCSTDKFKQAYKYFVEQRLVNTSLEGHFCLFFKYWELFLVIQKYSNVCCNGHIPKGERDGQRKLLS